MLADALDLHYILIYPITEVLLLLAHSDRTPLKTEKATLTKTLESRQEVFLDDNSLPPITAAVIDGGIILHETVLQHKSTYATMAKDLLAKVCLYRGEKIHLVLDKYQSPSIKDTERNLRRSTTPQSFIITGPNQAQRQSGTELLKSGSFKEEFVMEEWKKLQYGSILGRKTLCFTWWCVCGDEEQRG